MFIESNMLNKENSYKWWSHGDVNNTMKLMTEDWVNANSFYYANIVSLYLALTSLLIILLFGINNKTVFLGK